VSFSFLERSVKILVVDDEAALAALFLEHLNAYPLYDASTAFTAKSADAMLSSSNGFHVCLLDLGMSDINGDEYYLIKKHAPQTSFIIITARDSLDKGFKAGHCGAFTAIKKPVDFYQMDIFNIINEAFSKSIVTSPKKYRCKPIVSTAAEVLTLSKPDSVREWADCAGVDERYLRRAWEGCFGYLPKHILWFNKVFYFATLYYNNYYRKKFKIKTGIDDTRVEDASGSSDEFEKFYLIYKKTVARILNKSLAV
jgi:CheY-like chemotaxis protein